MSTTKKKKSTSGSLLELVLIVATALALALGIQAFLVTRHLRKAGQSQFDPRTGRETTGQFESTVRFELVRGK